MPSILDELNLRIIRALQDEGRISIARLSRKLNTPRTTLIYRINELEKAKIIKGYRAEVDPSKLGYVYTAFILVKARRGTQIAGKPLQVRLIEKLVKDSEREKNLPWIEEAHIITGEYDVLLKVRAKNIEDLTNLLIKKMADYEEVVQTVTLIVLTTPHENHRVPVD
ncbi:MAG: Lrp/AsnC family transcriptional regulator [Thaumarchaeota archaeon]|nr:MAG: Lrp/AsnC family transcriptional regulator [Nitrososphaerota archaeon]